MAGVDSESGLRERKKRETRQRVSDVATGLFLARGFDNVTISDIAEAANVSKMTVFNYFRRKEDMFFDRGPEAEELLRNAIRNRPPGQSITTAMRRLLLDLIATRHPLSGLRDGLQHFVLVVVASPTLIAGARELVDELERQLTQEFATATGQTEPDPQARLAAALVTATARSLYQTSLRRLTAGERADDIYPEQAALVNRAFDLLDPAIDNLCPDSVPRD